MSKNNNKPQAFAVRSYADNIAWFKELAKNYPNQPETFKALCEGFNKEVNTNNTEGLETDLALKNNEIETLKNRLEEIKNKVAVNDPSFVFTPSNDIKTDMQRCISYLIKKGEFNRQDKNLAEKFTKKAIEYFITNEFTFIKK